MKYSNGVEARVGDKFRRLGGFGVVRTFLCNEHIMMHEVMEENGGGELELMHRPFQVGDMVQYISDDLPREILPEHESSIGDKDDEYYVHENPLWRDHPDNVRGEDNE